MGEAYIRRDAVAGSQEDMVAHHQFLGGEGEAHTVPFYIHMGVHQPVEPVIGAL